MYVLLAVVASVIQAAHQCHNQAGNPREQAADGVADHKQAKLALLPPVLDGHLVLLLAQLLRGSRPAKLLHVRATLRRHLRPQLAVLHQATRLRHHALVVPGFVHQRGLARARDDVQQPARRHRHHGQPGGHGLERHKAERLRLGGHHEDVGAGISLRQLLPLDHTHELDVRDAPKVLLQFLPGRAIAHECQAHPRHLLAHLAQHIQVLLRAQTAHVHEQRVLRVPVRHARPHLRGLVLGVEHVGVHAALPHVDVVLALVLRQLILHDCGGD
mmetsp:Transcript_41271/g.103696  ORF Transcript_41271/g.103696 Transcript_41271/m.103696 type:complete len:272 (+) Transcript_41271:74-889(+)